LKTTRRQFVALAGTGAVPGGGAGAGLVLGCLPAAPATAGADADNELEQAFVRIAPSGEVTVIVKHLEMGQGIASGLAAVLAEELDADWSQLRTEAAPFDPARYRHLLFGQQTTGGSTSMSHSFQQLREAGATARAMLLQAAALRWSVPVQELTTHRGVVLHGATHRRAGYGELASAAAALPVPALRSVALKPVASFGLIGRARPRLGVPAMTCGETVYGIDIRRPGQRVALLLRPPRFGGRARQVDAAAAQAVPGVRGVHTVPQGVAVVADRTWAAMQARRLLNVQWDDSAAERRGSAELRAEFRRLADAGEPGVDGLLRGDPHGALAGAAQVIEAEFELPYLAHQPMEPLAAVAELRDGRCDIWAASQNPSADHAAAVRLLQLPPENIALHVLPAGGSFGRRATFDADWISALLQVVLAHGGGVPIQLLWAREDDVRGGFYRPMTLHRLRAGLDASGRIVAVDQTIVSQSFLFAPPRAGAVPRHDPTATDGHLAGRFDVPAARLRWVQATTGVPVQMYRALSFNHTTFTKEVLMDELARAAGQDAVAFRLAHLAGHPRQAAVLREAAAQAGWGRRQAPGRALGVAVQEAEKSFVAQIARVRIEGARIVVEHVVCVIDCGIVIDPGTVTAQMEGGIAFGLTQALMSQITLDAGQVQQSNFHDAPVLRMARMPTVQVVLLRSSEPPTGVGEPGSVVIAAAVANAVAQLTGQRVRSLPLQITA
jgi:isoquinoline 1-oxidoreductase beta subunit